VSIAKYFLYTSATLTNITVINELVDSRKKHVTVYTEKKTKKNKIINKFT